MTLRKIISGGQTGADQAGLLAAGALGLETGGTAPPGYMTDAGPQPTLLMRYGLVEGEPDTRIYPRRTEKNVLDSDGSVIFGNQFSPGCQLTIRLCTKYRKPCIINPTPLDLYIFVLTNNISVLNVAGNRERTNPGIGARVVCIIMDAFGKKEV